MDFLLFFTYMAACGAAATTGAVFSPGEWYKGLSKPWWTPKDWMFPVAWMIMYVCMSWAAMRIAQLAGSDARVGQALALWSVQIALNTLWTPIFFGLKRIGGGLIVITLLWLAVAATTVAFFQIDWVAGALFAPYLLWVSVAGALNRSVWVLNPRLAVAG